MVALSPVAIRPPDRTMQDSDDRSLPAREFARQAPVGRVADISNVKGQPEWNTFAGANILSTVAHELRVPLTAMSSSAELLAEDAHVLDGQQVRAMASAIRRNALWMQGLVENLLCAETVRQGRFQIHPVALGLMDLLLEIRPVLEPLLARKEQQLRLIARHVALVSADSRRIGQVLVNLISNASKFADAGTPIVVVIATHGAWVRLSVADRGPGVPAGASERLFEPFYRTAAAARSGQEGVGLGLAVVKSIVEEHGGRVGVENRRGGGARFWFELPVFRSVSETSANGETTKEEKE
jgi:two-component system, OmpR family, sensor histidine kinase KdpD